VRAPNTRLTPTSPEPDRRVRRSWWFFVGTFLVLGVIVVLRLTTDRTRPIDWLITGLVVVVGLAAILHQAAVRELAWGRREEAEWFARILSGLSRSISPDAIVDAIARELDAATGADHIVVVRRRTDDRVLEATLVSTRPGVADSTTILPISDLEDPVDPAWQPARARRPVAIPIERARTAVAVAGASPGLRVPAAEAGSADRLGNGAPTDRGWSAAVLDAPVKARSGGVWTASGRLIAGLLDLGDRAVRVGGIGSGADGRPEAAVREGAGRGGPARAGGAGTVGAQLVADRIAARVRSVYGLRDTLAAPLTSDAGVVGAIVLSRRVADTWPAASRRMLAGAAYEASAALARAYSHRAAEQHASTDALTGLPNRRYFDEFCGLLARRRRANDAVGVLMIDIDRFKGLNDRHGHATGDEVLRAVGRAIVSAVREDDVPARYGGEEFVVLLRNPSPQIAGEVGERVRDAVGTLDLARFGVGRVSVSVGVAVAATEDEPIADLIERADKALYRAKRTGRDRVVAA
jgi:diguanylate cyclase (GGDEF)-like protein